MWRYFFLLILLCRITSVWAEEKKSSSHSKRNVNVFQEGQDYFSYQEPFAFPVRSDNKVLIQFFFDYDCRVCSTAQDTLNLYSQINQNNVVLKEIPVATEKANLTANIFYTLQAMNAENISDLLLFESSEKHRYTELASFPSLLNWLQKQNIDAEQFKQLYNSNEVQQQIQDAIQLTENYGVFTYPYVIVGGKYVLTASTLYNDDYSFAVLDFLINKLLQEKK